MKKSLAVLLVLLLLALAGCGRPNIPLQYLLENPSNALASSKSGVKESGAEQKATEKQTQAPSAENQYKYPEYKINSMQTDFNDGVAWAYFDNNYSIVNEKGEMIYVFRQEDYSQPKVHPFVDGVSYISSAKGLHFIDSSGNELFTLDMDENTKYEVVGRGGGIIMLYKTVNSFSQKGLYVTAVDTAGKKLTQEIPAELQYTRLVYDRKGNCEIKKDDKYTAQYLNSWQYLKNGIFYYGNLESGYSTTPVYCCIFNSKTGAFFRMPVIKIDGGWGGHYFEYSMYPYYYLDDEKNTILSLGGMVYDLSILDTHQKVVDYLQKSPKRVFCWNNQFTASNSSNLCGEGMYYVKPFDFYYHYYSQFFAEIFGGACPELEDVVEGYYDYDGKLVAKLPSFPAGVEIIENTRFSGGYALIHLKGVDGRYYASMIDTKGKQMFDPVLLGNKQIKIVFYGGYLKVGDKYLNYEGKMVEADLLPEKIDEYFNADKGEKKKVEYAVASSDTKVFPGSKAAELIKPVLAEKPTKASSTAPAVNKKYITPARFSIEGKWKNTGSYTFGQVQKGAIVSFDGINCNVYSPKDTYAFYKDGNQYKLECTSLLFSETLTFTVKIVDENHIDIYYGSNCLEMTRID